MRYGWLVGLVLVAATPRAEAVAWDWDVVPEFIGVTGDELRPITGRVWALGNVGGPHLTTSDLTAWGVEDGLGTLLFSEGFTFTTNLDAFVGLDAAPGELPSAFVFGWVEALPAAIHGQTYSAAAFLEGANEHTAARSKPLAVTFATPAPVPEPSSMILLGLGLVGVWRRRSDHD